MSNNIDTALRSFFEHVTSHDEEGVHAALCMVANAAPAEPGAPTHMHACSFGAGDPDALAQMIIMAIDTMVEEVPGFKEALKDAILAKRLQYMISQVLGMEAVKSEVDALIEKLKSTPGAVPGPETKQ